MSDHHRLSSPSISASSGRPTTISRPSWPWQVTSGLHSSSSSTSSLDQRSHLHSPRSTGSPSAHSASSSAMSHSTTRPTPSSTGSFMDIQEDSTKQWSFMGFEWVVRDVHKLRDYLEGVDSIDLNNPDFEILKDSPMLGGHTFKLEIAFTPPREVNIDAHIKPTLSLFITPLMVDFAQSDYELSASMMAAIKCQTDRVGERGAPPEWVWDFWQTEWIFRQEQEVWECPLPPLSVLLENSRIRETDSFTICVQIHCPAGPSFPKHPSFHSVPRDLLDGLEASLDNSNTGDVRFVCLERSSTETPLSPTLYPPDATTPTSIRSMSSTSSYSPFSAKITARKRIIYAHSDILTRRSEYFATMLASSFSENPTIVTGERKVYTVVVEEADFETIYWLLKFCYANWLLFREQDDPRTAMDGIGVGWNTKWSSIRGGEWDWKVLHKDDSTASDTRSVASGESIPSVSESRMSATRSERLQSASSGPSSPSGSRTTPSHPPKANTVVSSSQGNATSSRRTVPPPSSTSTTTGGGGSNTLPRPKPVQIPIATTTYIPSRSGHPLSPRTGRQGPPNKAIISDPHPHPTIAPRPASALSVYQVAHRYAMPGLATLALEHMMSTITPQSSFALLLATSVWDGLHLLVEDYVVEKWDEVSVSEEFEQCCQEVAAGEWGADGGKTLMSIFRRLRSPNTIS